MLGLAECAERLNINGFSMHFHFQWMFAKFSIDVRWIFDARWMFDCRWMVVGYSLDARRGLHFVGCSLMPVGPHLDFDRISYYLLTLPTELETPAFWNFSY